MKNILAIDPGDKDSAFVLMTPGYEVDGDIFDKFDNDLMLKQLQLLAHVHKEDLTVVLEMVASYGMAVGKEVFDTCVWIGRFAQAAMERGCKVDYVYRMEEKMALCHDSRAKDTNIRQALIDRFAQFDKKNGKGTKKNPDVFYGFRKDVWSAFAVGVTWLDKHPEAIEKKIGGQHEAQRSIQKRPG